ncbi:HlyC/CorC family transporter [Candidatus Woesearchaeota archaeon]|nr:HlyC/CorC family transporter [Candidatus Woesearchaeota archaeon]
MASLGIQLALLATLIFFSAFFSGIETALMSISAVKVNSLLQQRKKGAETLHRLKQNPHKLIITILIGNNLVNIGSASLATVVFTNLFGSSGIGIATGVMTFLILVFGEITPKTLATQNAEKISLKVAKPIELLSIALSPFVWFFGHISNLVTRLFGSKDGGELSEEELKTIVTMGHQEGVISREAAEMMHNILEFKGTKVTKIMTPKIDMHMVDGEKSLKKELDYVIKTPYSCYPIYIDTKDKIIGHLDVDDVLAQVKKNNIDLKVKQLKRPVFFVPEYKEIHDLLKDFEKKKISIAIVVDEYAEVSGLVTVEDVLEEIVGDIFDKSNRQSIHIKKASRKLMRVDAKISVAELNKELHLGLKDDHFNTLAGFIEHRLHKIPKKGERIKLKNVIIEVDQVTKQGIKSVKIMKT